MDSNLSILEIEISIEECFWNKLKVFGMLVQLCSFIPYEHAQLRQNVLDSDTFGSITVEIVPLTMCH